MEDPGLVIVTEYRTEHTSHRTASPSQLEQTQMFLEGRERRESDQGRIVVLVQPDLRREVWLDRQNRTFTVRPIWELATVEERERFRKQGARFTRQSQIPSKRRVTYDVFIQTDRLEETAEFFGFPARRYVTRRRDVYPESAGKAAEVITDGWYLDFHHPAMPQPSRHRRMALLHAGNEQPVIHRSGEPQYSGMPAKAVTNSRQSYRTSGGERIHISKHTVEIRGITECVLDPALFEVPEGFQQRPVFPSRWSDYARQFQKMLRRISAA